MMNSEILLQSLEKDYYYQLKESSQIYSRARLSLILIVPQISYFWILLEDSWAKHFFQLFFALITGISLFLSVALAMLSFLKCPFLGRNHSTINTTDLYRYEQELKDYYKKDKIKIEQKIIIPLKKLYLSASASNRKVNSTRKKLLLWSNSFIFITTMLLFILASYYIINDFDVKETIEIYDNTKK